MSAHEVNSQGIDPIREAAALWHERLLADKVSQETREGFARWREEAPEHAVAYDQVCEAWRTMQSAADDPRVLALRHEAAFRLTHKRRRYKGRWLASAAAAALAAIALSFALAPDLPMPQSLATRAESGARSYTTATGERLAVTLEDGSQVTLNTDTALETKFSDAERTIVLARGQALFEVAKDKHRPFVVEAQGQRLVAVGTAFDVRVQPDRVQITMVEGTVKVEPLASLTDHSRVDLHAAATLPASLEPILLTAGQQLSLEAGGVRVRKTDAERVTSWRAGQVIFDNTRLIEAIDELNRYSERKIELADPALADLRLSGAFATGRTNVFVEAVTSYFPVEVAEESERQVLLAKRR